MVVNGQLGASQPRPEHPVKYRGGGWLWLLRSRTVPPLVLLRTAKMKTMPWW
ncbi:hypothetical protein FHX35_000874 [Auritidibacter ignavus]|nr:hypothetical protein [Auritidibacter ignavus]